MTFWPANSVVFGNPLTITQDHLAGVWPAIADGTRYASRVALVGNNGEEDIRVSAASSAESTAYYGLVERRQQFDGTDSARAQLAVDNLCTEHPPITLVGSETAILRESSPTPLSDLVPGCRIRVALRACGQVEQMYTLAWVNVEVAQTEQVAISVSTDVVGW